MSNCSMPRGALVPNCEVDNRLEHPRRWCTDLADGEYRALPLGVPDGLVGASECKTERGLDSSAGNVTIDEFRPFWICSAGRSLPPLEIRVDWEGWHGRGETWFANPGLVVTDQNGVDVTGKCTETRRVYTEVVKGPSSSTAGSTTSAPGSRRAPIPPASPRSPPDSPVAKRAHCNLCPSNLI